LKRTSFFLSFLSFLQNSLFFFSYLFLNRVFFRRTRTPKPKTRTKRNCPFRVLDKKGKQRKEKPLYQCINVMKSENGKREKGNFFCLFKLNGIIKRKAFWDFSFFIETKRKI
jgi:hypothetical protein